MKLALVDVSNLFWSSWHATAGQDIDAAYRVTLERISRCGDGCDAKVACLDVGKSWRHAVFPEYKAGRAEREPAAWDQLRRVKEQLMRDGFPCVGVEGYEADDTIASIATKAPPEWDVVIFSGDSDFCQLVCDGPGGVVIQSTNQNGSLVDEAKVREKYGVTPEQFTSFRALTGDKSDAVPGCPGCGPVHAARLLNELGSLDVMLEHPEAITPEGIRSKFLGAREQIILAKRLVTLSRDVPITFEEATRKPVVEPENVAPPVPDEGDESVPKDLSGPGQEVAGLAPQGSVSTPAPENPPKPGTTSLARVEPEMPLVLDRSDARWTLALEPRNAKMLWWYCEELHKSQLYRKFGNADAILAVVLRGRALGLDMTTSLDVFHVIEGKPTLSAMAIVGLCISSGKAEYFDPIEFESDDRATWETKRVGRPSPVRLTYTIADAELAGLTRPTKNGAPSNWVKRPRPMLRKQAAVELARLCYPDICSNIYSPDEMTD